MTTTYNQHHLPAKDQIQNIWMHPHSKHWHPIDYVIVRRCDIRDVLRCWAMRGAECWTDHQMIMAKVHMSIHPPPRGDVGPWKTLELYLSERYPHKKVRNLR